MNKKLFKNRFSILFLILFVSCSGSQKKTETSTPSTNSGKSDKKVDVDTNKNVVCKKPILKKLFYGTTLGETLKPVVPALNPKDPNNIPADEEKKFGLFEKGDGETHIFRDDLETGVAENQPKKELSLLFFSHIADVHITDEEAPGRATLSEAVSFAKDAYRPQQDLTAQVLDSTIRTINEINKVTGIDFIMNTGDVVDSSLFNELRLLIDIMDGKGVNPDSGIDDDPKPGPQNDSSDPFKSEGTKIPWYVLTGNHNYVKGLIPHAKLTTFNDIIKSMKEPIDIPGVIKIDFRLFYIDDPLGDYSYAVINPLSPDTSFAELNSRVNTLTAGKVAQDSNRKFVNQKEFIGEFFNSASSPNGHGFTKENLNSGLGNYTFLPKEKIPIRFIALDTMNYDGGWSEGDLSKKQVDKFLIPLLEKAKKNKELVIVTAHHPIRAVQTKFDIRRLMGGDVPVPGAGPSGGPSGAKDSKDFSVSVSASDSHTKANFTVKKPKDGSAPRDPVAELMALFTHSEDAVTSDQLRDVLLNYPNVILYLAGDSHDNRVSFYKGKSSGSGFWHIETSSLIDYPQQTRLLEVVYDGNGIGSIYSTMLDFNANKGSLPYLARSLSLIDVQYDKIGDDNAGGKKDRNVILKFKIPKEISDILDKFEVEK